MVCDLEKPSFAVGKMKLQRSINLGRCLRPQNIINTKQFAGSGSLESKAEKRPEARIVIIFFNKSSAVF